MAKRKKGWTPEQRAKHAATWKAKRASAAEAPPQLRDVLIYLQHAEAHIIARLRKVPKARLSPAETYTLLALTTLRDEA